MSPEKPNVLILGGTGFVGRHLVDYIVSNDLAGKIRVCDRVLPVLAWLNTKHKASFAKVEFKQANLLNSRSLKNAFTLEDGVRFNLVFNCAAEGHPGHDDDVYEEGIHQLSVRCAIEAKSHGVDCFVEVSSGYLRPMLKPEKDGYFLREDDAVEPCTSFSKYKYKAEQDITKMKDFPYIIIRPGIIYGTGDKSQLMPRLVVAAVYRHLNEKMKTLQPPNTYSHTIHVDDLCRAMWHLVYKGEKRNTYHVVDNSQTTEEDIAHILEIIFKIEVSYVGNLTFNFIQMNNSLDEIIEEVNVKHAQAWSDICLKEHIENTPLSPLITKENLLREGIMLDNSKLLNTGFFFKYPKLTKELLGEMLREAVLMNHFPSSLV